MICRFFKENPTYVKLFPFDSSLSLEEIVKDKRFKMHAGRVMTALSGIVDTLNAPDDFQRNLQKVIDDHKARNIQLSHFLHLKAVLVQLLIDKLGAEVMNDEAKAAWAKAYDAITCAYEKSIQS